MLEAFAILRRDRALADELPPAALRALKQRGLEPVAQDAARLLRSAGDARAWVVPVPDVDRADPFVCRLRGARPREGVAVVSTGGAPAGGGGALHDLMRGIAPVAVDPCAGERRDMLGVSGIVPDGVPAVFLTAPDGTAVRADVKDNAFAFVVARGRRPELRHVVWNGSDGTPHVQPVMHVFAGLVACGSRLPIPVVTPGGGVACSGSLPPLAALPPARRLRPFSARPAPRAPRPPVASRPRSAPPAARALPRPPVATRPRTAPPAWRALPRPPIATHPRPRRGRPAPAIAVPQAMRVFFREPCASGGPLRFILPAPVPPQATPAPPRPAPPLPAKPRRKRGP